MDGTESIRAILESVEIEGKKIPSKTVDSVMSVYGKTVTAMQQAQTDLKKANADLEAAQKEVNDIMATHNSAYEKDEETYKAKYETAAAELETAKAATATAEKALSDRNVEIETEKTTELTNKVYSDVLTNSTELTLARRLPMKSGERCCKRQFHEASLPCRLA